MGIYSVDDIYWYWFLCDSEMCVLCMCCPCYRCLATHKVRLRQKSVRKSLNGGGLQNATVWYTLYASIKLDLYRWSCLSLVRVLTNLTQLLFLCFLFFKSYFSFLNLDAFLCCFCFCLPVRSFKFCLANLAKSLLLVPGIRYHEDISKICSLHLFLSHRSEN